MEEIELSSWDKFSEVLSQIKTDLKIDKENIQLRGSILYRGQSDSEWKLRTTLERYSSLKWRVDSYTRLLLRCAPEVESFTGQSWNIPKSSSWTEGPLPCQELWVYSRHCGFPSPLLDWTSSPYIAAFFAFEEHTSAKKASIFVYFEQPKGIKIVHEKEPQIHVFGFDVKTHKRHFLQQSCYTICTQLEDDKHHKFICHEDVFNSRMSNTYKRQDVLYKITLSRDERLKILSVLNEMNINNFSLFQSEESLMRTLAFRKMELKLN
jgi:hypothetical protein